MPARRPPCVLRPRTSRRAPDPLDAAQRVLDASRWPLDEVLVWEGSPDFACVWVRRHPELPRYAVALVHGRRDAPLAHAAARVGAGRAEAWTWIEEARRLGPLSRRDPRVAERLLIGALARARHEGDEPAQAAVCELLALSRPATAWLQAPRAAEV